MTYHVAIMQCIQCNRMNMLTHRQQILDTMPSNQTPNDAERLHGLGKYLREPNDRIVAKMTGLPVKHYSLDTGEHSKEKGDRHQWPIHIGHSVYPHRKTPSECDANHDELHSKRIQLCVLFTLG